MACVAAYVCFTSCDAGGAVDGGATVIGAFYAGDDGEVCAFDAGGEEGSGRGTGRVNTLATNLYETKFFLY